MSYQPFLARSQLDLAISIESSIISQDLVIFSLDLGKFYRIFTFILPDCHRFLDLQHQPNQLLPFEGLICLIQSTFLISGGLIFVPLDQVGSRG